MPGKITRKVVIKYILLQIPAFIIFLIILLSLYDIFEFSDSWLWLAIIIWILKDAVMFPFVWRSYNSENGSAIQKMIGKEGIAQEMLDPSGYVRIENELWDASVPENHQPVLKGEIVTVIDVNSLKLTVIPVRGKNQG